MPCHTKEDTCQKQCEMVESEYTAQSCRERRREEYSCLRDYKNVCDEAQTYYSQINFNVFHITDPHEFNLVRNPNHSGEYYSSEANVRLKIKVQSSFFQSINLKYVPLSSYYTAYYLHQCYLNSHYYAMIPNQLILLVKRLTIQSHQIFQFKLKLHNRIFYFTTAFTMH